MRFPRITALCVSVVLLTLPALGQSPNGNINGLVLDPTNRVIRGAEIVAINDVTGVQLTTKTNDEGVYVLVNLPPGPYRLQVSKIGFKTIIKPDITLNVQDALSVNFTLPVGATLETITVEGTGTLLNTQSAAVSTVIDRNFVESLPLNGRSFNTLLQLTPGVVIAHAQPGSSGQFSISGQRTDANNFIVDGVSANFGVGSGVNTGESGTGGAQAFSALGGTSSLVSVDALQEFRVETSSFAPEFGRTPGGQVVLSTRSGTNLLHGGIFDYFRNTVMDANDWFADLAGNPRAPEHHNDFGGFLGGPIQKRRAFFFFSYEGARLQLPQTLQTHVPSMYARSIAPAILIPYLNAYPEPDDVSVIPGVYTSTLIGSFANSSSLDAVSLRLDDAINSHLSLFGRYNHAPSEVVQRGGPSSSLSRLSSAHVDTDTLTIGIDMILNPRIVNTIRGNYSTQDNRSEDVLDSFHDAMPLNADLLIGPLPPQSNFGYFRTADTSANSFGPTGTNQTWQMNLVDSLSVSFRTHQIKFGTDYRAIFLDEHTAANSAFYTAPSVQDFLSSASVTLNVASYRPSQFLAQSLSLYSQDTWKVTSRLTSTYGIRWELSPAPIGRNGTLLAAWQGVNDPASLRLAPVGTPLWKTGFYNFAPRFGVACSLDSKGTLMLRAGAGTFFDLGAGSSANLAFVFPNVTSSFYSNVTLPVTNVSPYLPPAASLSPPYPSVVAGYTPDLELPRSYQWNVALEKSFAGNQAASFTYVGQAGRKLLRGEAVYQPNENFPGDFEVTQNGSYSNYHALELQYRARLSSRLQALLNYTWSHSLDNASNDTILGLPSNIVSGATDYASSDFDVRQSFSGALSFEIPSPHTFAILTAITNHWQIQSVVVARSGFPFNGGLLFDGPDPFGIALSRPDRVSGESYWITQAGAPGGKVINPLAFSMPPSTRQGSEGRNDITGFGLTQIDFSLGRDFPLCDRFNLRFRADAFNIFNHPNFADPPAYVQFGPSYLQAQSMLNQSLGGGVGLNPIFQEGGPRSLQLSLKLTF